MKRHSSNTSQPDNSVAILAKESRIYVAGHKGLVGSALERCLKNEGFQNIIAITRSELDLTDQQAVEAFFQNDRIDAVFLAAAKVGGIQANMTYPADFIYQNLMIEANVIHAAFRAGVQNLLFLGSSCIYPKQAPQPMKEEYFLSGPLEPTNSPYALAKIAGILLCESYNRQHGTRYRAVMPTNLYGPNDNFDLENSHVLPAMLRKFHLAKLAQQGNWKAIEKDASIFGPIPQSMKRHLKSMLKRGSSPATQTVTLWGSGQPRREFLHVDDMAAACLLLMQLPDDRYNALCKVSADIQAWSSSAARGASGRIRDGAQSVVSHINIGCGEDQTIYDLAVQIKNGVGYKGDLIWDRTKPDGMRRKLLDISRLKSLGWQPQISLADGIQQTYQWYLKQAVDS